MIDNQPPIPMLDLKAQYAPIRADVEAAISRVMESHQFILGPEVEALEAEIARLSRCSFAIGVSSGTDALLVSLMTLGIGPGDEVITSPYSFFATAGAVVRLGAKPVFVDINPYTLNMDASLLESAVTPRTRAILPVHLAGQVADMDAIMQLANQHGLAVVEDACQALGADYGGRAAGAIGSLGCFSFFPSKNLGGAGDSGMVITNDPALADRVALLRNHGHRPKYYNLAVGGNFRMDALQAAILRAKLPHLEGWTTARQRNAALYREYFSQAGLVNREDAPVSLPRETDQGTHIYHLYQLRVQSRTALMNHLKSAGISTEIYYPVPLHLQACFADLGYQPGDLPHAERAAQETLALPIYPELTQQQIVRVVGAVAEFYR